MLIEYIRADNLPRYGMSLATPKGNSIFGICRISRAFHWAIPDRYHDRDQLPSSCHDSFCSRIFSLYEGSTAVVLVPTPLLVPHAHEVLPLLSINLSPRTSLRSSLHSARHLCYRHRGFACLILFHLNRYFPVSLSWRLLRIRCPRFQNTTHLV